jgi:hypothetical protein
MRLCRSDILLMLPEDVLDALPHPCAPDREQRVTEELLKVVDVPQGKYVLRALYAHNHYFFHVEPVNKPCWKRRKGTGATSYDLMNNV